MNEIPREESPSQPQQPAFLRWLRSGENGLVILVLALLVLLPLVVAVLRKVSSASVAGASGFIQHFTLLISVLGGAIAAREGRLLSLSSLTSFLKGRWLEAATVINGGVATAIGVLLCIVGSKYALTQPSSAVIAYGIPIRAFQILLPAGYGVIAARLWWHSSTKWGGRGLTLLIAGALVWLGCSTPVDPAKLVLPALLTLLLATVLGAPVFTTLGGAAMILFWGAGRPPGAVVLEHYELVTQHVLASLPLFTLAGYFLAEGGASKRLVCLFRAFFSPLRGGPAIVTALVCAFFTSFTGASGVTILALGGLLMPVLISANYSEKSALGLVTGAGSLGMLFPPCLPLIVYATIAQLQLANLELPPGVPRPELGINQLFLGGIGPGLLLVLLTAWWGIRVGPRNAERPAFNGREAMTALLDAKWELLLPPIVLVVMFTGLATPVEAAAVAAIYALLTQTVVHRDLRWTRDVPRVMTECGLLIGGVLLILGVAMGLTNYLVYAEIPSHGVEWVQKAVHSKWVFLLLLNLFLLVVGCLMDVYSAIVVVVPLIVPMGVAFGVDPVHLGIVFLANLELGFLTPPVGMNLFLSSYRFGKPMSVVTRSVMPMLVVLLIGVLLITYVPPLTTTLPKLLKSATPLKTP